MIETNNIEAFEGKFENLDIYVNDLTLERFTALMTGLPKDSVYTNIWQDMNDSMLDDELDLKGKIHLFIKNQNAADMACMFFTMHLRVKAKSETDRVSVFTKTVQYLFGWIKTYTESNRLKGNNGEDFIVPEFPYSKSQFESLFS